jgi:hypothetical protein
MFYFSFHLLSVDIWVHLVWGQMLMNSSVFQTEQLACIQEVHGLNFGHDADIVTEVFHIGLIVPHNSKM